MTDTPQAREFEAFPIVGAHFRPPAKGVLECLPQATLLALVPEPDNMFDANAVKVCVSAQVLGALPEANLRRLDEVLPLYGSNREALLAVEECHLGYVPKGLAAGLAPRLAGRSIPGELRISATGGLQVTAKVSEIDAGADVGASNAGA